MHTTLVTTGRVLLGLFFVVAALLKIKGGIDAGGFAQLSGYIQSRIPVPTQVLAYATIAFEIICGLAIVFGYFTTAVSLLLALFCLATAVLFHNFWAAAPDQVQNQLNNFMKNIGLAGAFLILAGEGIRVRMATANH
jgi:putative oxidoreductase